MNDAAPTWLPAQIAEVTCGRWLRTPAGDTWPDDLKVSIDTRSLQPCDVFLALRGENFNGHSFLAEAMRAGASALIIDEESAASHESIPGDEGCGALLVADTRAALRDLAVAHRDRLGGTRVIGITGSNGKTTTKRLLHAALSMQLRGSASPHSFNNDIGVPLTILGARQGDDYLVVEIGTNAPGEIRALSEIARPDVGVITSISATHLQGLGSVEGVCSEKLDLLRSLPTAGPAIINADSQMLMRAIETDDALRDLRLRLFGEGEHQADLRLDDATCDEHGTAFSTNDGLSGRLSLLGTHNALNALAALLVAREFGVNDEAALIAMGEVQPDAMRLVPQQLGSTTIYNDAYNANPESMSAAIQTFAQVTDESRRRVLVLGDMLELGSAAEAAHYELGRQIALLERDGCVLHLIILVGDLVQITSAALAREQSNAAILPFSNLDDPHALIHIGSLFASDDQVLVKGSRALGLERIVDLLAKRTMQAQTATQDS